MFRHWVIAGCMFLSAQLLAMPTAKVIGGDDVTPHSLYPWMTSLQYVPFGDESRFQPSHFCGASLIASQWLMTSAHCVDAGRPDEVVAAIGKININFLSDSETLSIEQVVVHPEFNQGKQFNNDIALLRLTQSVTASPITVARPSDAAAIEDGDAVTIAGWGSLDKFNSTSSPILQQATQSFYDSNTCKSIYGDDGDWLTENMICSGGKKGVDSCFGDSGGPVFEVVGDNVIQHGLISWGVGCDVSYENDLHPQISSYPGGSTKVANYADWIDSHVNGLSLDSLLDFAAQPVSGSVFSVPVKVINNSGTDSFTVNAVQLSSPSPFELSSTDCIDQTLSPNSKCTIFVKMQATSQGLRSSELEVNTQDGQVLKSNIISNVLAGTSVADSFLSVSGDWFSSGPYAWKYENGNNGERIISNIRSPDGGEGVLLFTANQDGVLSFYWRMEGLDIGFQYLTLLLNDREVLALQFDNAKTEKIQVDVEAGDMLTWILDSTNPVKAVLSTKEVTTITSANDGGSGGGGALFSIWLLAAWWIRRRL